MLLIFTYGVFMRPRPKNPFMRPLPKVQTRTGVVHLSHNHMIIYVSEVSERISPDRTTYVYLGAGKHPRTVDEYHRLDAQACVRLCKASDNFHQRPSHFLERSYEHIFTDLRGRLFGVISGSKLFPDNEDEKWELYMRSIDETLLEYFG